MLRTLHQRQAGSPIPFLYPADNFSPFILQRVASISQAFDSIIQAVSVLLVVKTIPGLKLDVQIAVHRFLLNFESIQCASEAIDVFGEKFSLLLLRALTLIFSLIHTELIASFGYAIRGQASQMAASIAVGVGDDAMFAARLGMMIELIRVAPGTILIADFYPVGMQALCFVESGAAS